MIGWPGLKPSLRFHSRGLTFDPLVLAGIAERVNATRLPVGVFASRLVCA